MIINEIEQVQILPIEVIRPSPENDKVYRPSDVSALAKDIKKRGLLEPIVITRDCWILSGHRRYAACRHAGLTEVKCKVHNILRSDPKFVETLVAYNEQRIKTVDECLREEVVKADPRESYRALTKYREQKSRISEDDLIEMREFKGRARISKAKEPFLAAILKVVRDRRQYWPLSVRQIHYALLSLVLLIHASKPGSVYRNDLKSYRATSDLCARARLVGRIPWSAIDDETRPNASGYGYRNVQPFLKSELDQFLKNYYRDLMQSQPNHIEIVGEKNTIHTVVQRVAMRFCLPYTIGRGYCSLSPRKSLVDRFRRSGKDNLILLILADFDPDGEEIAHSFARSIRDDFGIEKIKPIKVALTHDQVNELPDLPPSIEAKESSPQFDKFFEKYGSEAHELEAVEPGTLEQLLTDAIDKVIDTDLFNREVDREAEDAAKLDDIRRQAYRFFQTLASQD